MSVGSVNTSSDLTTLAAHVRELTERGHHIESFRMWKVTVNPETGAESTNDELRWHKSTQPSLLTALRSTIVDQAQTAAMAASGPARNVPRLNLDAVDRMDRITRDARDWAKYFELDHAAMLVDRLNALAGEICNLMPAAMRPRGIDRAVDAMSRVATQLPEMAEWDIRALVGAAASATEDERRNVCVDVARWRAWCRVFAGWEVTPWRPNARCPATVWRDGEQTRCDALAGVVDDRPAGLRVRLEAKSAVCLSCDATWGDPPLPAIDSLAEHILAAEQARNAEWAAISKPATPEPGPKNRGGRS